MPNTDAELVEEVEVAVPPGLDARRQDVGAVAAVVNPNIDQRVERPVGRGRAGFYLFFYYGPLILYM